MNKWRKNNNLFKKLKFLKEENSAELQKPNVEAEVYDNNKNNVTEEKQKAQKFS